METTIYWQDRVAEELGICLHRWQSLAGGDFAQSYVAQIKSVDNATTSSANIRAGAKIFIKTHVSPPPNHFSTEGRGLEWLAQANSVHVPTVLGVSDEVPYLAIVWVEQTRQRQIGELDEAAFGRELAGLHQAPCLRFGREDECSTGSLALPNAPCDRWSEFYASQRLLPLVRIASERNILSHTLLGQIETLAARLDQWESSDTTPSRLHGDLWAGNRLVDVDGKSWVIDPASHGGHREFDLAMMRLFGGFGNACFSAYREAYPMDPGWQDRIPLHQLAPLVVHAIKFGNSYVEPIREALSRYV